MTYQNLPDDLVETITRNMAIHMNTQALEALLRSLDAFMAVARAPGT